MFQVHRYGGEVSKHSADLAKITAPSVEGVLYRERLFSKLDTARQKQLIWVTSPAGAGKTVLVGSYIESRKLQCLWYQVDGGDDDLASFFYYMGLAGRKAAPRKRSPLPALTPEYMLDIPTFSRNFFEDLFSGISQQQTLIVLDNYQEVKDSAPLHNVIIESLSRISNNITFIVLSRTNPPPPFARSSAYGQIPILGWQDLRFTREEFMEMTEKSGYSLGDVESADQLYEMVDGWVSGLQLVLEIEDKPGQYFQGFDRERPEKIFDYFAGEIFDQLETSTKVFLVKTSFLPNMTISMAESLTGNAAAARILSALCRNNLFTEQRRQSRNTYQYHPLFREFLLDTSEVMLTEEERGSVQRHAAGLLVESQHYEDAAHLLSKSKDVEGLVKLIMGQAEHLLSKGRNQVLLEWFQSLPEDLVTGSPWLQFWLGAATLPLNPQKAQQYFEHSFKLFKESEEKEPGVYLAYTGIIEALFYGSHNFYTIGRWLSQIPELFGSDFSLPPGEIGARVVRVISFSCFWLMHPEREQWEKRALATEQTCEDISVKIPFLNNITLIKLITGRFADLDIIVKRMKDLSRLSKVAPLARIEGLLGEIVYKCYTDDYDAVKSLLQNAMHVADESGVHVWDFMILGNVTWKALSTGNLSDARRYLKHMKKLLPISGYWDQAFFFLLDGYLAYLQDDITKAAATLKISLKKILDVGVPFSINANCILFSKILFRQGNHHEAFLCLHAAREDCEKSGMLCMLFSAYLHEAYFYFMLGKEKAGITFLQRAMNLGSKINCYPFYFEIDILPTCCSKALEYDLEREYALALIRTNRLTLDPSSRHIEEWPWPIKIYTLGRFSLLLQDKPLQSTGRAQQKPLALLKAILSYGGRNVSGEKLADVLWPDADGDLQQTTLHTTLHRLRSLLKIKEAIQVADGKVSINPKYCWVDTWAFERLLGQAETLWQDDKEKNGSASDFAVKALNLYKGGFLADGAHEYWHVHYRERLRSKFLRGAITLGKYYEKNGNLESAIEHYHRGLEVDPHIEEFYQRLMTCYLALDRKAEAAATYKKCTLMLRTSFDLSPAKETKRIYQQLEIIAER